MSQNKARNSLRLKIRLPDNAKRDFTKRLLNWAERQKPGKETNWFLLELQAHRDLQRSLADLTFKNTRPPEDTTIEFLGFRLIEVFHYEEFEKVRLGLIAMFPTLIKSEDDFIKNLEETSEAMTRGLLHPVGTIYGEIPVGFLGARVSRSIPTIHTCIKSIDVELQKISPSLIVMSFDVRLKDIATSQLNELLSQKYFGESGRPEIHFGKYPFVGISLKSSEKIMTESINNWISTIRENVEATIKPYLAGYFLSKNSNKHHLPSVEVFVLSRAKLQQKNFSAWATLARNWCYSLGFNLSAGSLFGNKELMFSWRDSDRQVEFNKANKIFIFSEKYLGQSNSMWSTVKYLFAEITPFAAVVEFFDDSQVALEKMRRLIFDAMGKRYNPSQHVQLHQNFQVLGRTVQRLNLEIDNKMFFFWGNKFFDTTSLVEVQLNKSNNRVKKSEKSSLLKNAQERTKFLSEMLSDQIVFIDRVFSTHIEFLNVDAVYRLQKITVWLTIAATVVGVIGIVSNLSELAELFKKFMDFLHVRW
jgi:hypothetical protein